MKASSRDGTKQEKQQPLLRSNPSSSSKFIAHSQEVSSHTKEEGEKSGIYIDDILYSRLVISQQHRNCMFGWSWNNTTELSRAHLMTTKDPKTSKKRPTETDLRTCSAPVEIKERNFTSKFDNKKDRHNPWRWAVSRRKERRRVLHYTKQRRVRARIASQEYLGSSGRKGGWRRCRSTASDQVGCTERGGSASTQLPPFLASLNPCLWRTLDVPDPCWLARRQAERERRGERGGEQREAGMWWSWQRAPISPPTQLSLI